MAFKYKASVEEIDKVIEEEESVCEDDEDTEDDIYLRVLEYIQEVETKIEKKTDEEMVPSLLDFLPWHGTATEFEPATLPTSPTPPQPINLPSQ